MIEVYGTADISIVVNGWLTNPLSIPNSGEWGFSHAALSLLSLETAKLAGATNTQLSDLAYEEMSRWYVREAIARCNDGISDWLNPLLWDKPSPDFEDSRLDYWTPRVFIEWYLSQL